MRSLIIGLILGASSAQADIELRFIEGAPKDRFDLIATGPACNDAPLEVTIDLSGAQGGLIFDVTAAGQGVEVYQPFELVAGADLLQSATSLRDGDQVLTLSLRALPAGQVLSFTTDLDDTGGGREITVDGAEIAGASVIVTNGAATQTAEFGPDARAIIDQSDCLS
ncbi:aggregation factor core [Yoonia sp. SS1-5]|uniref:Aggregation factor core n=1 Tax=Yoonia rhodophyticola TaxID=3137370 RepID=A0AAN0M6V2_9RHOB